MTVSIISTIVSIFTRSTDAGNTDLGPEHIVNAVYGNQSVTDITEATMGQPVLRDFGTQYFTDYQIVIPLEVETDVDIAPFVFDIPEDPTLEGDLEHLAQYYDVESIDDIARFEGATVPIEWSEGTPTPDVGRLYSTGGRDTPWEENDVDEFISGMRDHPTGLDLDEDEE